MDPGTTLTYSFNAINPPAGTYTLGVSTSSDTTMVSSPSFTTTAPQSVLNVTAPTLSNAGEAGEAGEASNYAFSLTTSSTGGLIGGSTVTVTFPNGGSFASSGSDSIYDGNAQVAGGCSGNGTTTLTCSIYGGAIVESGDTLTVNFSAFNPPSGTYSLGVSTSSDSNPATTPNFEVGLYAHLGVTTTSGNGPLQTSFSFTPSDPFGVPVTYSLAFGDGQASTGTDSSPYTPITINHSYTTPDTYNATLIVSDSMGESSSSTVPITVFGTTPPEANAGDNVVGVAGSPVTLDGSGSQPSGSITSYQWTLGDGTTAGTAVVEHSYANPGTYTAQLTVTANGKTNSASITVTVVAPSPGLDVTVTDASTPLPGVSLAVITPDGTRYAATTGSSGQATIDGLPDGSYTVYAYAPGYLPASTEATVSGGSGSAALGLQTGDIAQTSATSTPLSYQQIVDAGLNPDDPANQNVYYFTVNLAFGPSSPVAVSGDLAGCGVWQPTISGATQTDASGGWPGTVSFSVDGYDVTGSVVDAPTTPGSAAVPELEWMILPRGRPNG